MAQPSQFFTGDSVAGVSPTLLSSIEAAVRAQGGTSVYVISGKRAPGPGNDVKNSNHITGDAIDGYAVIGGKQVPLGQAIVANAGKFGLRSGDVPGFDPKTQGGWDPDHVDDGANVGGVKPYAAPATSQSLASQLVGSTGTAPSVLTYDPAHPDTRPSPQAAGALYGDALLRQIQQTSTQLGLDPNIALAVAPHEGGFEGAVGDGGTSFGPWQLHAGGALPAEVWAKGPTYAKAWANSPAGLTYALTGIKKDIGGATGASGVRAVVTQFERPASQYVAGEVAKALATYGSGSSAATTNPVVQQFGGSTAAPGTRLAPLAPPRPQGPNPLLALARSLLA